MNIRSIGLMADLQVLIDVFKRVNGTAFRAERRRMLIVGMLCRGIL
jgi:hypothetical protein